MEIVFAFGNFEIFRTFERFVETMIFEMRTILEHLEHVSLYINTSLSGIGYLHTSVSPCTYVYGQMHINIFSIISRITMAFICMYHNYDHPFNCRAPFIASVSTEQSFAHCVPGCNFILIIIQSKAIKIY